MMKPENEDIEQPKEEPMLTMYEVQNKILDLLPTYQEQLRSLEKQLIKNGVVDHEFLSRGFVRGGRHIFGFALEEYPQVKSGDVKAGDIVPIDYIPCDHTLFIIRHKIVQPIKADPSKMLAHHTGHETCPLCGKALRVSVPSLLDVEDLVLVGCPRLKEGKVAVDVLPIFSITLIEGIQSVTLSTSHQRSKNAMTRVNS